MNFPIDYKYTQSHEWIKFQDQILLVGITDVAQEQLGDIVFVGDVQLGKKVVTGEVVGVIESVKAASDIYAPVSGKILDFNHILEENPGAINESAYTTWIFKIDPNNIKKDINQLLDATSYRLAHG